jgi:hypothetical protein
VHVQQGGYARGLSPKGGRTCVRRRSGFGTAAVGDGTGGAMRRAGLRTLPGGKAERFGMGPPVVLGQRLAEGAGPAGHGPLADLAAGDRKLSGGDRETA